MCLSVSDFSMNDWFKQKGLVAGKVDALTLSLLYEELGVSTYLKDDECEVSKHTAGWKRGISDDYAVNLLPKRII